MKREGTDASLHTGSPRGKVSRIGQDRSDSEEHRHQSVNIFSIIRARISERVTLAMRARRKERTRNLKRSSSVCMMIRRKLVLGSVSPVCCSTSSILLPQIFALAAMFSDANAKDKYLTTYAFKDATHQWCRPGQDLGGTTLGHPCTGKFLKVARFLRQSILIYLSKDVIDVHAIPGEGCSSVLDALGVEILEYLRARGTREVEIPSMYSTLRD